MASKVSLERASFGAGCFWGVEKWFKKEFPKLASTSVGYQGGAKDKPTYKEVCTGKTGHAEVLQVEYDPAVVKFEDLVRFFYRVHDPTTIDSQGPNVGSQYRSAIFYETPEQKAIAEKVTADVATNAAFKAAFGGRPVVTKIEPAGTYYKAEDYHQDYLEANPGGYCTHKVRW
jgi:peptide-methionine (S)-S-oxide reductase